MYDSLVFKIILREKVIVEPLTKISHQAGDDHTYSFPCHIII